MSDLENNYERFTDQYDFTKRNYNIIIHSPSASGKYEFINHILEKYYNSHNIQYSQDIQINPDKLKNGWSRNKIIEDLIRKGVGCNEGSCSELYREKSFRNLGYFPKKRLKNARKLSETSIAFQIDHTINYKELQKIILSIKDTFQKAPKKAGLKVNELIKK